jgi:hypothetical protein
VTQSSDFKGVVRRLKRLGGDGGSVGGYFGHDVADLVAVEAHDQGDDTGLDHLVYLDAIASTAEANPCDVINSAYESSGCRSDHRRRR